MRGRQSCAKCSVSLLRLLQANGLSCEVEDNDRPDQKGAAAAKEQLNTPVLVTLVAFVGRHDTEPFNARFSDSCSARLPHSRISPSQLLCRSDFLGGERNRLVLNPFHFENSGSGQIDESAHAVI